jgi:AP-3 complex subunit delta-1
MCIRPLRADERLPVRSHRTISHDILPEPVNKPKKHKKAKKEKKKSKVFTNFIVLFGSY